MNQTKQGHRRLLVAGAVAGLFAAGSVPAPAQDIRVEVTGSSIRRLEGEGALPVQVFTRSDIEKTGAQSAADLLQYVSAANSAGATNIVNTVGATTFSASVPSLRGLGGQTTLVLINGKRLAQFSGEIQGVYGVNLDAIPFAAIERVEILKDGASAVYGSDAIAGVINFILRQDYTGAEVSVYGAWPTRSGGGDAWNASATVGFGDLTKDKYNFFVTAFYEDQKALDQNQRNFSNSSYRPDINLDATSGNTFPAFISTGGIGNTSFPNCEPSIVVGERCRYDPARIDGVNSIPSHETLSFYASGRWQINPDNQFYATGAWSRQEVTNVIQPVPISDQFFYGPNGDIPSSVTLPPTSPFYPTAAAIAAGVNGQDLNYRYRCVECGNRDSTDTNEQWQIVTGLKGVVAGWDYDIDFAYSKSETKQVINGGYPDLTLAIPLLSSGRVNPFGPNSPEVSAQLRATGFTGTSFKADSDGWVLEGKASRDLFKLPAGALAGAFGAQYGEQSLNQEPNPVLAEGNISGFGGNLLPIDVSRDWWAVFAEFAIPVVKTVEFNAAVRYDHYSDFGGTTNPKFSLRWNPAREFLVRASWGTGFVAPSLTQLYGANISGVTVTGLSDPLRCPTTNDSNDCDTQFPVTFGGNPNLQPQTSTQWMVGFVFEPTAGVSFGFDWFNLDVENLFINGISPATILSDLNQYGNLVTRAPPAPPYPTLPGRIINMDQRFINLGRVKIDGFDVDIQARSPQTSVGRFNFQLTGSYYNKYDVQQLDGSFAGFVSNALFAPNTGVTPRYRQYATLTWTYGPWATTLGNLYQSGYIDWNLDPDGNERRASSMSLWDLLVTYTGLRNWTFTVGAKNLFDTDPPLTNQQVAFQAGYDPSYYDARARFIYAKIGYAFK